jgi:hypothetical protein
VPDAAPLLVSVHDVAPATLEAARRWAWLLDERDVPITFQVIAGPWRGAPFERDRTTSTWLWVRRCGGDEVALHAWTHRAPAVDRTVRGALGRGLGRGTEEFWALGSREAAARVRAGLDVLAAAELEPVGFAPPGGLLSREARHAIATCGLRYLADRSAVRDLRTGTQLRAPGLSMRAGGLGERAGALTFAAIARRRAQVGLPVRIQLHPEDLDRPHLAGIALDVIDEVLAAGHHPTTVAEAIGAVEPVVRSAADRSA